MDDKTFANFLKILVLYKLKQIPRNSSNQYHDEKEGVFYRRRETDAEHVYSSLRLADFFLTSETEFADLSRLRVYELIMYHEDVEIIARDTGISEIEKRKNKEKKEREALKILHPRYPAHLDDKLILLDAEYRERHTEESKFAKGIDKLDALVHELQYPTDWGPKGFDEKNVRAWFQPAFEYSPTFMAYFEKIIEHLNQNGYFNTNRE